MKKFIKLFALTFCISLFGIGCDNANTTKIVDVNPEIATFANSLTIKEGKIVFSSVADLEAKQNTLANIHQKYLDAYEAKLDQERVTDKDSIAFVRKFDGEAPLKELEALLLSKGVKTFRSKIRADLDAYNQTDGETASPEDVFGGSLLDQYLTNQEGVVNIGEDALSYLNVANHEKAQGCCTFDYTKPGSLNISSTKRAKGWLLIRNSSTVPLFRIVISHTKAERKFTLWGWKIAWFTGRANTKFNGTVYRGYKCQNQESFSSLNHIRFIGSNGGLAYAWNLSATSSFNPIAVIPGTGHLVSTHEAWGHVFYIYI